MKLSASILSRRRGLDRPGLARIRACGNQVAIARNMHKITMALKPDDPVR
jgi:hypothetical protein